MLRHKFALLISLVIIFSHTALAQAQDNKTAPAESSIPSPRSVLGFAPGADRTVADWQQLTGYFALLDKASDRVQVETLGTTTLKRPLIALYISAPENIRELQRFKEIQAKLADPRTVLDERERDRLIHEGKAVVAITCSVHATELVASQMSMQLAFELATAEDEETLEILRNTILLLIPSVNPDGLDTVAGWYRQTLGTPYEGTTPPELSHTYAGDDNSRDWFMLNLQETRLVTKLFWKEWFPEIVYDVQQQGQTGARFFVPPFYEPTNPNIQPLLLRETGALGSRVAADLQASNFQGIITGALADTWGHGGMHTAPFYHNSAGLLSAAASAKLMTPVHIKDEQLARTKTRGMASALEAAANFPLPWRGGVWGTGEMMALEMAAARSILSQAAKSRAAYLRNFYELGRNASNRNAVPKHPLAYLIPAGQGKDEAVARLIEILVAQGVEVQRMNRELHMTVPNNGGEHIEVPLGSYLIFLAQPARWNIQALFEPQKYPDRREANGEAEPPVDVAGWTLPVQMGIETIAISAIREYPNSARRLTLVSSPAEVRHALGLDLQNGEASPIPNPIKRPVRLAVYKSKMSLADEGWTRWVLDTFNVPYESLPDADMRRGNLRARYDVIILPSQRAAEITEGNAVGSYPDEFTGGITEQGVLNLRRFVEAGGTLICFDASTELAIKRFQLPLRNVLEGVKSADFYCPGSILRLSVDVKDPISKGLNEQADAFFINSSAFEATDKRRVRVIARYAGKDVLRSGWLIGEGRIAGRIALAEITLGKGRVILFGFRPQHRGQTWGTFPFIFNAIMSGARAEM